MLFWVVVAILVVFGVLVLYSSDEYADLVRFVMLVIFVGCTIWGLVEWIIDRV